MCIRDRFDYAVTTHQRVDPLQTHYREWLGRLPAADYPNRAMTSLGMATPPILSGLSLSRAVQTRVSAPSTARSPPMVSRCSTSKLERRNSVTREAISTTCLFYTSDAADE